MIANKEELFSGQREGVTGFAGVSQAVGFEEQTRTQLCQTSCTRGPYSLNSGSVKGLDSSNIQDTLPKLQRMQAAKAMTIAIPRRRCAFDILEQIVEFLNTQTPGLGDTRRECILRQLQDGGVAKHISFSRVFRTSGLKLQHPLFTLVPRLSLTTYAFVLPDCTLKALDSGQRLAFREVQSELLRHFARMRASSLRALVCNNTAILLRSGCAFNPLFTNYVTGILVHTAANQRAGLAPDFFTVSDYIEQMNTLRSLVVDCAQLYRSKHKGRKTPRRLMGFCPLDPAAHQRLMECFFSEQLVRHVKHVKVHEQRRRVEVDPDGVVLQGPVRQPFPTDRFSLALRRIGVLREMCVQAYRWNVFELQYLATSRRGLFALAELVRHYHGTHDLPMQFHWRLYNMLRRFPQSVRRHPVIRSQLHSWNLALGPEHMPSLYFQREVLVPLQSLFKGLDVGKNLEKSVERSVEKLKTGFVEAGVEAGNTMRESLREMRTETFSEFSNYVDLEVKPRVFNLASDLSVVADNVTRNVASSVTTAGCEVIGEARRQFERFCENASSDFGDFGLSIIEYISIAYISEQPSVRWLSMISMFHRILSFFKMHRLMGPLMRILIKYVEQSGRRVLLWFKQHVLPQAGIPDVSDEEIVAEPEEQVPLQAFGLDFFAKKFMMERALGLGFSFVKDAFTEALDSEVWHDSREQLKKHHEELYIILEGLRLAENSGGLSWVQSDPTNAAFAHYIGDLASKVTARYALCTPPIQRTALMDAVRRAREMDASVPREQSRPGATIIYLYGERGQGKSTLAERLASDLSKHLGYPSANMFSLPRSSEYFDGYFGQPIFMMNDIMNSREGADNRVVSNTLLDAHDVMPLPLNMSKANEKGANFFHSPVIIATSNVPPATLSATITGLTNVEALKRRLDFEVRVSAREPPEWEGVEPYRSICVPDGDHLKLSERKITQLCLDQVPDSAFQLWVSYNGEQGTDELSYEALLMAVKNLVRSRESRYRERNRCHERMCLPVKHYIMQGCHSSLPPTLTYHSVSNAEEDPGRLDYAAPRWRTGTGWLAKSASFMKRNTTKMQFLGLLATMATLIFGGYRLHQHLKDRHVLGDESDEDWEAPKRVKRESKTNDPAHRSKRRVVRRVVREGRKTESELLARTNARLDEEATALEGFLATGNDRFQLDDVVQENFPMTIHVAEPVQRLDAEVMHPYVLQGCDDSASFDLMSGHIVQQTYYAEFYLHSGAMGACQAFNFAGRFLLVPLHTWNAISKGRLMELHLRGARNYVIHPSYVTCVKKIPQSEAAVIELGRRSSFCLGRDLIGKFSTEDDLPDMGSAGVLTSRLPNKYATPALFGCTKVDRVAGQDIDPLTKQGVEVLAAYRYPLVQTFAGMCCSPLLVLNGSKRGKIIGLHCAGDIRRHGGYAAPLYQSDFSEFHATIEQPVVATEEVPLAQQLANAGVLLNGLVTPPFAQVQSIRSSIRPSPVFNQYSVTSRGPAVLRITNGVDPLVKGQAKQLGVSHTIAAASLEEVKQYMVMQLGAKMAREGILQPRRLTISEAIRGTARPHEDALAMSTSAGFPFNVWKPGGKDAWFTRGEDHVVRAMDEDLYARVVAMNRMVDQGVVPSVIFRDTLKDEKLPLAKIYDVKTRVFSAAPVDFTIAFRQDFLGVSAALMQMCVEGPIAVGIDAHGVQWGQLYRRFSRIPGDSMMCGDFKTFDGTLVGGLTTMAVDVLASLVDDQVERRAEIWSSSLANAWHITGNLVYQMSHGIPSGTPVTSLLDSICNWGYHLLCWLDCGYTLDEWEPNVEAHFFGDDSLVKVAPEFERFNMVALRTFCSRLGVTYTSADKDDQLDPYWPLSRCSFLKRSFVERDGIVFAPLDWTTLIDFPNWVRSDDPIQQEEALRETCTSFFVELSHYPEQVYLREAKALSRVLTRNEISCVVPRQDTLLLRYQEGFHEHQISVEQSFRDRGNPPRIIYDVLEQPLTARGVFLAHTRRPLPGLVGTRQKLVRLKQRL
uniref:RNA-directed RNA polymerase n=1 Tax=Indotermes dicistro-like virus 1 TaxID=3032218 RepID=A0AAT9JG00_9VIRU